MCFSNLADPFTICRIPVAMFVTPFAFLAYLRRIQIAGWVTPAPSHGHQMMAASWTVAEWTYLSSSKAGFCQSAGLVSVFFAYVAACYSHYDVFGVPICYHYTGNNRFLTGHQCMLKMAGRLASVLFRHQALAGCHSGQHYA